MLNGILQNTMERLILNISSLYNLCKIKHCLFVLSQYSKHWIITNILCEEGGGEEADF